MAYGLNGLSPDPTTLLQSYEDERRAWAERVVTSDKRWNDGSLPFYDMFTEMREQVLGCGVEEKPSLLTSEKNEAVAWQGRDLLGGVLRTGRRLFNVKITRWADGTPLDLHEDFPSDGRYRILVLAGSDFPKGRSRRAIESACALTAQYVGVLEEVVLQPKADTGFEWSDMPAELKQQAEMRLHTASQDVYETYGVSPDHGALALVRPDGIVGVTTALEGVDEIERVLQRVLKVPSLETTEAVTR